MKNKKKGKLKWIIIAIIVIAVIGSIAGGGDDSDKASDKNPKKVSQSTDSESNKDNQNEDGNEKKEEDNQKEENTDKENDTKVFMPGDTVETSDLRITFVSAKKYKSDNEFVQPKKGNIYYKMKFEFENISDSDKALSTMIDWTCYADSYKVDQNYLEDDNGLDASLSPGKKAKGSVYFELPKDAKEIMLEYSPNFWTDNKVVFKAK